MDDACCIFYKYDDSPRNGYNYHGMTCEASFELEDGGKNQCHIPLGLEILENGCHQPQADKAVEILGANLTKVPSTMADNAAKDVGDKIFQAHRRRRDFY